MPIIVLLFSTRLLMAVIDVQHVSIIPIDLEKITFSVALVDKNIDLNDFHGIKLIK